MWLLGFLAKGLGYSPDPGTNSGHHTAFICTVSFFKERRQVDLRKPKLRVLKRPTASSSGGNWESAD